MPSTQFIAFALDTTFRNVTAKSDANIVAIMAASRPLCSSLSANLPSFTLERGISNTLLDFLLENANAFSLSDNNDKNEAANNTSSSSSPSSSSLATGAFKYATRITLRLLRYESFANYKHNDFNSSSSSSLSSVFDPLTRVATHLKEVQIVSTSLDLASYVSSGGGGNARGSSSSSFRKSASSSSSPTQPEVVGESRSAIEQEFYSHTNEQRVLSSSDLLPVLRNLRHLEKLRVACNMTVHSEKHMMWQALLDRDKDITHMNPKCFKSVMPLRELFSSIADPHYSACFKSLKHLHISGYLDPSTNLYVQYTTGNAVDQNVTQLLSNNSNNRNTNNNNNNTTNSSIPPPPIELLQTLPNLEILFLNDCDFRGSLGPNLLRTLPRNLRHFECKNNKLRGTIDFGFDDELPSRLEIINLGWNWFQSLSNFETLASHVCLKQLILNNNQLSGGMISTKQRTTNKKSSNNKHNDEDSTPQNQEEGEQRLATPLLASHEIFTHLPPYLELLNIRDACLTSKNEDVDLSQLPESLIDFYAFNNDFTGTKLNLSKLPSTPNTKLKMFNFENCGLCGDLDLTRLPSSLQMLHLGRNDFSQCFDDPNKFNFNNNFNNNNNTSNLRIIYLNSNKLTNPAEVPLNLKQLPPNLAELYIHDNAFCGLLDLSALPTSLEKFIAWKNKFDSIKGLDSLPASLKHLEIADNKISNHDNCNLFRGMGECAKSLIIFDISKNNLSGRLELFGLPDSLETFMINDNPLLDNPSCDLSRLPKSLKRLDLTTLRLLDKNPKMVDSSNSSDDPTSEQQTSEQQKQEQNDEDPQKLLFGFATDPEIFYHVPSDIKFFDFAISFPIVQKFFTFEVPGATWRDNDKNNNNPAKGWDLSRLPPNLQKLYVFSNQSHLRFENDEEDDDE